MNQTPVQFQPVRLLNPNMPADQRMYMTELLEKGAGIRLVGGKPSCRWREVPRRVPPESLRIAQLFSRTVLARESRLRILRRVVRPIDFVLHEGSGVENGYLGHLLASDLVYRYARYRGITRHIPALRIRRLPTAEWTVEGIQTASLRRARVLVFTSTLAEDAHLFQGLAELSAAYEFELAGITVLVRQETGVYTKEKPGNRVPLFYFFGSV